MKPFSAEDFYSKVFFIIRGYISLMGLDFGPFLFSFCFLSFNLCVSVLISCFFIEILPFYFIFQI